MPQYCSTRFQSNMKETSTAVHIFSFGFDGIHDSMKENSNFLGAVLTGYLMFSIT